MAPLDIRRLSDDELLNAAREKTAAVDRETRILESLIVEARRRFEREIPVQGGTFL